MYNKCFKMFGYLPMKQKGVIKPKVMALMKDLFYADLTELQWKEKLMSYLGSDFFGVCVVLKNNYDFSLLSGLCCITSRLQSSKCLRNLYSRILASLSQLCDMFIAIMIISQTLSILNLQLQHRCCYYAAGNPKRQQRGIYIPSVSFILCFNLCMCRFFLSFVNPSIYFFKIE